MKLELEELRNQQANVRLKDVVAKVVSVDSLKHEIEQIKAALKNPKDVAQATSLDEQGLADRVTNVLARWESKEKALRQEIRQELDQLRHGASSDSKDQQISPEELIAKHRQQIMAWIKDITAQEIASVEDSLLTQLKGHIEKNQPKQPASKEIVAEAQELIQKWMEEKQEKLIPQVLNAAKSEIIPDLNARIASGEKQMENIIEAQGEQIARLGQRQDQLDASLSSLANKQASLVLNDEQLREVVRLLNSNRAVKATSFDEQHVLELIRQELEVFAADRVNMSDWALSAGGARIMPSHTSQGYAVSFLDFFSGRKSAPPSTILNPSLVLGDCWAFAGDHGNATIKLPQIIKPKAFTLDHISRALARDFRSAPQHFSVWGYKNETELRADSGVLLGEFRYDIYGPQVQTFFVEKQEEQQGFRVIKLSITSNYGRDDFTCVYRFRVHGDVLPSP